MVFADIKINLVEIRMDPRVREIIEGAMNSCANDLKGLEPHVDTKMAGVLESCFSKNSSNSDRFAECITEKNKKVESIMKGVEFKMMFFSKVANQCLSHGKSVQDCTQETIKGLKEVIANTKKSIEQI